MSLSIETAQVLTFMQGDGVSRASELLLQAASLNANKSLSSTVPAQMLLQSSLAQRLGPSI